MQEICPYFIHKKRREMKITKFSVLSVFLLCCLAFIPPKKKFIDPANIDAAVKPGDNFFLYANGVWLKNNPIPPSKTRWGSFDELREQSSQRLKGLLESAAKSSADSSMQKIGDFYASGMDSLNLEKLGYQPIKPDLERIESIKDIDGVLDEAAYQQMNGISYTLFGFTVGQDAKNVTRYIPEFFQAGTSLPDRDYYIKNDTRSVTIRKAYLDHIQRSFQLIGTDSNAARKYSDAIMRIETTLAKSQLARVELRDPYKTYNILAVNEFNELTPSVDWNKMLVKLGINKPVDSVVLNNKHFFQTVDMLLSALPLEDWKAYLAWHVLNNEEALLSSPFVNENFLFAKVLSGQKEQTPRWQRMSTMIDGDLGDELGKIYVSKYFKPASKARMQELVQNLQQTFASRIKQLDWMSPETKVKALEKLNAFTKKIAYPDKWKNYSGVAITKNNLVQNDRSASRWNYNFAIEKYGKPVDKSLWGMTPPTINAYYNPSNNEIVFPAGILQFPFYDFDADDAVNYGGIAAVIGHEMTHGFDDQGRQYGADGNLKDWWTTQDADSFKKRADEVVKQYNAMTVQDTIHINGKLTLGENLADFGGLAMAYEAFTHTKQFKENKNIDGFTPTQRFFLNWAQVWRSNIRPETEAQYIVIDPHSPAMYRANIPPSNMDVWYEAFNVKEGDKMFIPKDKRVKVW
jgi:putative endopeptidase